MSTWTVLTAAVVLNGLPTAMRTAYDDWLVANPEKADRLEELTDEAVATCRAAVESGSPLGLDPDETAIPTSG